jgi:ribonuclease BN (tRNA processing enzyme)
VPEPSPTYRLRFLGAGGAFSRRYGTTCSELVLPNGDRWLIDCGRQAPDQLHHAGLSWHEVAGQLLTHTHGDHIYGLEDFAFSRYFYEGHGIEPIRSGGPRIPLVCHGAVRAEAWDVLRSSLRYLPDPAAPTGGTLETYFDPAEPVAAEPPKHNAWAHAERFEVGELRVTMRETVHVPGKPSTSIEFDLSGGKGNPRRLAWWSGDSIVDPALLTGLEPYATLFFHDCTFLEYPGQVHGSFSLLEKLPEAVRRKMVLMHHEDDLESHRERAESLGFRIALPGHEYDLLAGQRVA